MLIATTRAEAFALLAREPAGLLVLDLTLPGLDGLAMLAELGRRGPRPAPPVLALASPEDPSLRREALRAGAASVLSKPVDLVELDSSVRTLLGLGPSRPPPFTPGAALYRELVELQTDIIARWSFSAGVTFANSAAYRYLGLGPEQLLGRSFEPWVLPEDLPKLRAHLASLRPGAPTGQIEHRLRLPSGEVRWTHWINHAIFDGAGRLVEFQSVGRDTTRRRQMEQGLQESEERSRAMLAALPDLLFRFDSRHRFIDFVAADPSRLAAPPQAFLGKSVLEAFGGRVQPITSAFVDAPSFGQRLTEAIDRAFETGQLQVFEYPVWDRWFEARIIRESHDRALAIARDITESKRAARELDESRARFAFLVNHSPASIYTCAAEPPFATTFLSENVRHTLGYQAQEFVSDPRFWVDRLHPDDAPRVLSELSRVFESGKQVHEYRFRASSGEYRWMRDELSLVRGDRGAPVELVGYWVDITEQKRAEEALHASEERFRNMAETVPDILFSRTVDGDGDYLSSRFQEVTGRSVASAQGEGWVRAIVPEDVEPLLEAWQLATEQRRPLEFRGRLRTADGSARWQIVRARPMLDPHGWIRCWFGCITDVEEEVRAEQEARAAVHARDNLLAVVSHDLRTPLLAVQLSASALLRQVAARGAGPDGGIERILRSVERMRRLIEDLLTASTIEAGTFTVEPRVADVRSVLQEALEALGPQAAEKQVRLEQDVPADLPPVHCDPSRTIQALCNLLANAIRFAPSGGDVRVRAQGDDAGVRVSVSDEGPGMDDQTLLHLFDRYWTGREKASHGTGLGLYITRGIVEKQGGRVWVESARGGGTTFSFTIPTEAREPVAPGEAVGREEAAPSSPGAADLLRS